MSTDFIGGYPVHPELKGNIKLLMQTHGRPDVVASVEKHIVLILSDKERVAEELVRTERALNDANDSATYWREKADRGDGRNLSTFIGVAMGSIGMLLLIGIPKYGTWFRQAGELLAGMFQ
ncbi:hypothetical protein [Stenotrophomonas phage BUCT555]|nr:hypothetical protein [Stenotrophomonas phage BUCT555]